MVEIRDLILDFYEKKAPNKTMFMFGDVYKGVKKLCVKEKIDPPYKLRAVKKVVDKMVIDAELDYWSSGSTTYIKLAKPLEEIRPSTNLEDKLD
ncbi:MAG: dissimilatory sulfite reductase D family protein [Nanoarchaeota archaeon]|nr:dissimilatory sulfite reductase D family protein [Nanoarchaeota archaeon]MCG2717953.1 dissimilatory sulfite reductase D family protein [Nanoarchaeota archaeon]